MEKALKKINCQLSYTHLIFKRKLRAKDSAYQVVNKRGNPALQRSRLYSLSLKDKIQAVLIDMILNKPIN